MASKKKIPKEPWSEFLLRWGNGIGCLFCVCCLFPNVYWRISRIDMQMAVLYPSDRYYHPLAVTDKQGGRVSWGVLEINTCMKYTQFAQAQMSLKGLIGAVAGPLLGGGVVGCESWPLCKQHVAMRCTQYRTYFCMMLGSAFLVGCGAVSGLAGMVLRKAEARAGKKKKRIIEARRQTMLAAAIAFWCTFIGGALYVSSSDSLFHMYRKNAYYPYAPLKGPGFFLCAGAAVTFVLAWLAAIYRWDDQVIPCCRPKLAPEPMEGGDDPNAFPGGVGPPGAAPPGFVPPPGAPPPGFAPPPGGMMGAPPPGMPMGMPPPGMPPPGAPPPF